MTTVSLHAVRRQLSLTIQKHPPGPKSKISKYKPTALAEPNAAPATPYRPTATRQMGTVSAAPTRRNDKDVAIL